MMDSIDPKVWLAQKRTEVAGLYFTSGAFTRDFAQDTQRTIDALNRVFEAAQARKP